MPLDDIRVLRALDSVATISGGIFTGAALYVLMVEHQARFKVTAESARRQFQHSYPKAAKMQGGLSLVAGTSSLALGLLTGSRRYFVAATAFLAIPIYTVVAIFPTNNQLMSGKEERAENLWALLRKWSLMHIPRIVLSFVGFTALVAGGRNVRQIM